MCSVIFLLKADKFIKGRPKLATLKLCGVYLLKWLQIKNNTIMRLHNFLAALGGGCGGCGGGYKVMTNFLWPQESSLLYF